MKTFEERYTAWLDGSLPVEAQAAFLRELEERGETPAAREEYQSFQNLFRAHHVTPVLESADFFNHSLLQKLEETTDKNTQSSRQGWSFPSLAWIGGGALAMAAILFATIIPKKSETHSQSAYIAQVISARSADPQISATAFQTHPAQTTDDLTVVWLDGLDYVPENAQ